MNEEQKLLALCIWREARGEPAEAWRAIWHVILNRVRERYFGRTIKEVILYPLQFSSMTAPDDPQTRLNPDPSNPLDYAAYVAIEHLVAGCDAGYDPTYEALCYHADNVRPSWAPKMTFTVKIGRHLFYSR